jgi:hypothetical protein
VVYRRPHWTLLTARGGRDASYVGATHFLVTAITMASCGHGPLRALLALLITAPDALLGAVSCDIRRCLLVAAWDHLPDCLCGAGHDHLIAGGVLGGDAKQLLECASKEVALSALSRALLTASWLRAWATLVSLPVNLWLVMPSLPSP